ncbi:MAG: hypothetical protein IGR78_21915, partial [Fischerella thermalis M58_A2018_009]|nr:hypothetical protein [Fischerella thermalis M58_A2018_009]
MLTITLRRLFLPGDIEGFVALALENFVKLILIVTLCQEVLGFSPNLIYGRILPGIALSVCVGNCFYAWLAYHEGKRQSRLDMTALPYGVNTITVLPYIFLIMLPVRTAAIAQGVSPEAAGELAWQAGIVACLGSGVIKLALLWVVNFLQRYIPLAAHLSTLGGIALTFIAMGFFLRTFTYPIVSFVPLGIILLAYFGRVKFAIPAGLLAILLGTVLAWGTGLMHWDNVNLKQALQPIGIYTPGIWLGQLWQGKGFLWEYLGVIVPLGISEFICAFQNLETAEAVGDSYPRKSALMAQGMFTLLAAVSGSCFPKIDLALIVWALLIFPMFITAQFLSISWITQTILWSLISFTGLLAMVTLSNYWLYKKGLIWLLYCWIVLMLCGLICTNYAIFFGCGELLVQICNLWLGLSAIGYLF